MGAPGAQFCDHFDSSGDILGCLSSMAGTDYSRKVIPFCYEFIMLPELIFGHTKHFIITMFQMSDCIVDR